MWCGFVEMHTSTENLCTLEFLFCPLGDCLAECMCIESVRPFERFGACGHHNLDAMYGIAALFRDLSPDFLGLGIHAWAADEPCIRDIWAGVMGRSCSLDVRRGCTDICGCFQLCGAHNCVGHLMCSWLLL
ncbi:hypothetical protein D3C75_858440 [compost metagenome]